MPAKAGIHGLNAGSKALTPREFLNLRAELYGLLRKNLLNKELTLPDDQELAGQISAVRFFVTSEDQLQIESKDSVRSRGGQSPDKADALVLTLYQDLIPSQLIYF